MGLLDILKKTPSAKELKGGFGEYLTKYYSKLVLDGLVIHDVLIDGEDGYTSQIDLVIVGLKGVYVVEVKRSERGPQIIISRTHPGLVRRLLESEVPEIFDGTVEIKSVSREAGSRSKIAVYSADENVDPVGACIGQRGARINKIVDLLGGEKLDVVRYSEDPTVFVAAALAPADVLKVEIDEEREKACHVTVPDTQLSLAIGNKGQNARLAAKLTGWKIDIRPESGFFGEDTED